MKIIVNIEKDDLKFSYDSVKSLLLKFAKIEQNSSEITDLSLRFNFDPEDISELSTAIVWRLALKFNALKCNKAIIYRGSTKTYFDETHFLDRLTGKRSIISSPTTPLHFETFEPVRPNNAYDNNSGIEEILSVVTKNALDSKNTFHQEVKIHMLEVINNAYDHSESILEAGTICRIKPTSGLLDFCVADMGQGIKKSFLGNKILRSDYLRLSDQDSIDKATDFRVSCNPSDKKNEKYPYSNGGIGLFFLREFIKNHKDSFMIIISGKGYYYVDGAKVSKRNLDQVSWPGTIVCFRTNLQQIRSAEYDKLCKNFVEYQFDNGTINIV
jgi:hypothetical protein